MSPISLKYMEHGDLRPASDCFSLEHEPVHSSSLVLRTHQPWSRAGHPPQQFALFSPSRMLAEGTSVGNVASEDQLKETSLSGACSI